ncbi:MAG: flagellin FliC [Bdellovibrionaceae bacterium]|nr:flagellin FliC [Pseudobdellovibrionaceae bacterium]MBX3032829.1 flagellin FliC [Pseudobdellovibrionaceae bacterium]
MGMRISTNMSAIQAQRSLAGSTKEIQKSTAQLSSGSRITKSADDAAGLAISENLKSQIRSMGQATRNANDGISMIQTAEGGLNEISNILTRLRELGIQSASDTISDKERVMLDKEVQQLKAESQRIAATTTFGSQKLIDGTGATFDFQVGIYNNDDEDRISYKASDVNASASNLNIEGFDFTTKEGAQDALSMIDAAQTQVNGYRANLGALQNRLESTVSNGGTMYENLSAANSRIRDTDVAQASSELMRNNILLQASTSTLAQANQVPQMALKLVG